MTEILNATESPVPAGGEMPAGGGEHYQTGTIVTSRFSLGPSVHARQSIIRKAARFWMAAALPLAALVIGGLVYDSRLLFVGAVIEFFVQKSTSFCTKVNLCKMCKMCNFCAKLNYKCKNGNRKD